MYALFWPLAAALMKSNPKKKNLYRLQNEIAMELSCLKRKPLPFIVNLHVHTEREGLGIKRLSDVRLMDQNRHFPLSPVCPVFVFF